MHPSPMSICAYCIFLNLYGALSFDEYGYVINRTWLFMNRIYAEFAVRILHGVLSLLKLLNRQ